MAADGRLVFAAYGNVFSAFARNKEVCVTELFLFVCLLKLVVDFFFFNIEDAYIQFSGGRES